MKNHLTKSLLLMAVLFAAIPVCAYDFSEENEDGKTIYYNIINEKLKTCEVTAMEDRHSWSGNDTLLDYVGDLRIPSYANGYQVSRIGNHAFSCCKKMTSVTLPNTITSIGYSGFWYCTGLTSISLPNSVTTIDHGVFSGCSGLTSVSLSNSVTSIGSRAFSDCTGLTSIVLPNSLSIISENLFYNCTNLTTVSIPNSVVTIGERAFQECSSLTNVTIPNSVTSIGVYTFGGCNAFTSITIPESVSSIEAYAFANCPNITNIVVEQGNPYYNSGNGSNAIIETSTNTLITGCMNTVIPNTVTSIGNGAFRGCTGLTSIEIPETVISIGNSAFAWCYGLTDINIPNSITSIEPGAFQGCRILESITIPNSVTTIGNSAFAFCYALTALTIPNSVTSIGERAFWYCTSLESVTSCITDIFETGNGAFMNCPNATLYVPAGMVGTYQSTADWNRLTNIEEIPGISLAFGCSNHGKVTINDTFTFTNKLGQASVYDGIESKFVFTPDEDCQLDRVLLNGLDVTKSVKDNQLTTTILPNSSMMVIFSSESNDINHDGQVNIADVVALVKIILGQ